MSGILGLFLISLNAVFTLNNRLKIVHLLYNELSFTVLTYYSALSLLSIFRRVRKKCETLLLVSSCLIVRPHGTTRPPLDGF